MQAPLSPEATPLLVAREAELSALTEEKALKAPPSAEKAPAAFTKPDKARRTESRSPRNVCTTASRMSWHSRDSEPSRARSRDITLAAS